MSGNIVSFSIHTEVTSAYIDDLLLFIYQNYIVPLYRYFSNVRRWFIGEREVLAFRFVDPEGEWYVDVEVEAGNPINVRMIPSSEEVPKSILYRLKEDLIVTIQIFEENVRRNTLYFAWVKREDLVLEKATYGWRRIINRIFYGNMVFLFMIFIILTYLTFLIFRVYTPLVIVAAQFVIILFADKIIAKMGDWTITPKNPEVYILQYHIPAEDLTSFQRNYSRDTLLEIKREIYKRTLAIGLPITNDVVREVFYRYGIHCRLENLLIKTVNLYKLVKEAARRFNMPIPKIVLSNIILPNAAATGPSPSRGLMLITTGLLIQLEEDEILSVIGHELSHLKGRDPMILFTLVSTEYLLRAYIFWPLIYYFGFLYYIFILSLLYFVAKFFEARADLESAIRIGRPVSLANALRKVGFRKIQFERLSASRVGSWLGIDPHPPVSFRAARLESIEDPSSIKHPFLRSVIDCVNGFLTSLRG